MGQFDSRPLVPLPFFFFSVTLTRETLFIAHNRRRRTMKPSLIFRMVFMAALVLVYSGVGAALSVRAANPSSDIVEFGGNATLGGDIAELGDAMWEWNKDNFVTHCNALTSKWTTSMSSSQSKCNSCGGKYLLGGYNRFCRGDYAYRTLSLIHI